LKKQTCFQLLRMDPSKETIQPAKGDGNIPESDNEEIYLSASDDEDFSQEDDKESNDEDLPVEENKQPIEEPSNRLETEGKYRKVRESVKDYAQKMYQKHQAVVEKRWKKYDKVKEIMRKREEGELPQMAKIRKLNKKLSDFGFEYSDKKGNCARAAILKGYYKVEKEEDLDQVILEGKMPDYICSHKVTVRLRDVLEQIDYPGTDYECGMESASVFCEKYEDEDDKKDEEKCSDGRIYVSNICAGKPTLDTGKFHNHCTECTKFGKCIHDYRNTHCWKCGHHYFGGFVRYFPCNFCSEPKKFKSKEMINSLTRLMVLVAGLTSEEMPEEFSDYGEEEDNSDGWGI